MSQHEPIAYSIPDAADAAGVGKSKIYSEIAAGNLRARKMGSRTLILIEDLKAWLANLPEATCTFTKP